jgi:hypothetical protein
MKMPKNMQISHEVQSNFYNINMEQGQKLNCYTLSSVQWFERGELCWGMLETLPLALLYAARFAHPSAGKAPNLFRLPFSNHFPKLHL